MSLLINRFNKWGFIHIPKTGGTSVTSILKNSEGTEYVSTSHNHIGKFEDIEDYFIFTIVRNPFTRIASSYYHHCRDNGFKSFRKFVDTIYEYDYLHFPQSYFISNGSSPKKKVSFIGRYENLHNDINEIFTKINVNGTLPHLNRNIIYDKHPNLNQEQYYKHFYTEEWMKDWVRERYENDFKIFNYGMDI